MDINLKAQIQDLNYERGFQVQTVLEAGGDALVRTGFFSFFYCSKAKGFYVWVCVSVLLPRIEPVGKPYREVCL